VECGCCICQWNEEKEKLKEDLASMQCYKESCEQWQLSIDQIKYERDKVMLALWYLRIYFYTTNFKLCWLQLS